MLFEALCIIGAGIVAKKAIENPEKTKDVVNRLGSAVAKEADRAAYNSRNNLSYEEREELHRNAQSLAAQTGVKLQKRSNYDFGDE